MSQPDPNAAFASFVPGFEFLQNLTKQASAGMAGMGAGASPSAMAGMAQLSQWVAPTFDVEELDRRIKDLKAVHFWLDQNTKALSATIQALEVQRMTLATLQGMNVSLNEVAESMKIRPMAATEPAPSPAPSPAPVASARPAPEPEPEPELETEPEPEPTAAEAAGSEPLQADGTSAKASAPAADPMQWWGSLTQQFQAIAQNTLQEMSAQAAALQAAQARATQAAPQPAGKAGATSRASAQPAAKAGATKPAKTAGKAAGRSPAKPAAKASVKTTAKTTAKSTAKAPTKAPRQVAARPASASTPAPANPPARKRWPA